MEISRVAGALRPPDGRVSGRRRVAAADDGLTVVELLAAFKRHAKGYYGPEAREYATYCTLAKQLAAKYGRTPAQEFGPLSLKAFRQSLVDAGLARRTVNHQTSRIRLIFAWGVENELIPGSVVVALRCVKGLRYGRSGAKETEPIKPVADRLVDATLPHLAPQVRAMVELQRATGMRSGEVCIMRTCDINTAGNVWTYTPAQHKNVHRGHDRIVYLGPKAQRFCAVAADELERIPISTGRSGRVATSAAARDA